MPLHLSIKKIEGAKPGKVYYPLELKEVPKPTPGPKDLLVRIHAASLNHRDLFIRQHLYPGISFDAPLFADGYGVVVGLGADVSAPGRALLGRAVLLAPSRGWASSPDGPEDLASFVIVGSALGAEASGAGQEFCLVPEGEVEAAPGHLTPAEGAALPLVGLTAWRALVHKAGVGPRRRRAGEAAEEEQEPPRNVLITGVGGGVALQALQFAVAMGHNVYVTSGDASKLERARALGAKGGVSYRDADWDWRLRSLLPAGRPVLDAVVDGAGGDIVKRSVGLLRPGGVIAMYGMTVSPRADWLMQAVLRNIELRGSTMGSRAEFAEMVRFVARHRIRPVVSRVVKGLDNIEGIDSLFEDMKHGRQFGKLVVEFAPEAGDEAPSPSKL